MPDTRLGDKLDESLIPGRIPPLSLQPIRSASLDGRQPAHRHPRLYFRQLRERSGIRKQALQCLTDILPAAHVGGRTIAHDADAAAFRARRQELGGPAGHPR